VAITPFSLGAHPVEVRVEVDPQDFTDTVEPHWWQAAKCSKGPAVGDSPSDARLGFCTECLPVEPEDLEDVGAIHG
jgi:hypothetical protein